VPHAVLYYNRLGGRKAPSQLPAFLSADLPIPNPCTTQARDEKWHCGAGTT